MESVFGSGAIPRVAGAIGVAAQVAAAYVFVLYPALTVPAPEQWAFYVAWAALVVLTIAWWPRHPWRSLLVPVVSVPAAALVLWFGGLFLRWGP